MLHFKPPKLNIYLKVYLVNSTCANFPVASNCSLYLNFLKSVIQLRVPYMFGCHISFFFLFNLELSLNTFFFFILLTVFFKTPDPLPLE